MSLATNITNLATRVATEFKSLRTLINGNTAGLTALTTVDKTNLVAAINEVKASAGVQINDGATNSTTVWSSTKTNTSITTAIAALVASAPGTLDTLDELAAALNDDPSAITAINTALANRVRVDAAQGLTSPQQVQARANIGAGTSSLVIGTTNGTAADAATLATSLAGKAALVHTHVANDISNASTVGKNVLIAATAADARTAIGAGTGSSNLVIGTTVGTAQDASFIGNPETDFVATFNTGLV